MSGSYTVNFLWLCGFIKSNVYTNISDNLEALKERIIDEEQFLVYLALVIVLLLLITEHKRYRWIYILAKTARRDFWGLLALYKVNQHVRECIKKNKTLKSVFEVHARSQPDKIAIYFENDTWTFCKVEEFSNKIARYFNEQGLMKGNSVSLLLHNCPEYPCIYLGLSTFGAVTSLINTSFTEEVLLYSITSTNSKAIIFGNNLRQKIARIADKLEGIKLYQINENFNEKLELLPGATDLRKELDTISGETIDEKYEQCQATDPVLCIFTSGATGLPKPVVFNNVRFLMMAKEVQLKTRLQPDDIIYDPLPLYSVAGAISGVGQAIVCGNSVILTKQFLASNYFNDCAKYNATVGQYMGDMCRYMLVEPENTVPVNHKVKVMFGNGLAHNIWKPFVKKFNIELIIESYRVTEATSSLVNVDSTIGSVGFVPRYMKSAFGVMLIKWNETTGNPIRNSVGLCIECDVGEPGLAVGKINRDVDAFNFEGYTNRDSLKKQLLRDVFKMGDRFFNSGDILVSDEFGYFYFISRIGDTYRWKGELVYTSIVESVISNIVNFSDVIVYSVELSHTDGRAGIAGIVDTSKILNIELLGNELLKCLPSFAIPIFIRVLDAIPLSCSYKLKNNNLRKEGFDIHIIKDDMFVFDVITNSYVRLTTDLYEDIKSGAIRL